ncbi:MAG: helix-turn-helix domain-containing protein [Deltaproteobacteria bacterium]|nr:helix-turn-helix domain-containing protein [Deltaproteobacteria bacterium]
MSEPNHINDSSLAVTLTVGQLREIVRVEILATNQNGHGESKLLTPEELADRLQVPRSWVYEQSRMGNLPTHRLGRYIRFHLSEVLASQKKD